LRGRAVLIQIDARPHPDRRAALKVEAVYPMAYETSEDVVALHRSRLHSPAATFSHRLSQPHPIQGATPPRTGQFISLKLSAQGRTPSDWQFTLAIATYDVVRLYKLLAEPAS